SQMSVGGGEYQLISNEDQGLEAARGHPHMGGRLGLSFSMSALRRIAPIIVLASLIVCLLLYYTSPMGTAAVFAPSATSERTGLPSVKTEAYPKRIRFRGTQRRLPQALIIGVRKCGTRALLEMLNLHPRVRKNGKEMHFFDVDERYANGIDWYRKKMPYSFDNQVTVEKTPSYFISREAPARVHAMNESTRLLLIVREPAIRVLSDYTQIMDSKLKTGAKVAPFHEKVLTPEGEVNDGYKAVKISQYAVHLLHWLREFPLEQIHIIDGDNLITDPFSEIDKAKKLYETFAANEPDDDSGNHEEEEREDINDPQPGPSSDSPPRKHSFVASKRWFAKFQKRYGLKSVSVHGEATSADTAAAEDYVKNNFKKIIEEG
ncbi:hypothetical protein SK128_024883, partial [Halocaridina rubra]